MNLSPDGVKNVHSSMSSKLVLGLIQSPIQCVQKAVSERVKRPEHDADHSPATSADVKKAGLYIHSLKLNHWTNLRSQQVLCVFFISCTLSCSQHVSALIKVHIQVIII
jgi:hypothetical protein